LQVALFAQEEFRARLQHPGFRNLVNRAAMSSSLENLSHAETVAMLRHRWLVAGGKNFPFTEGAIEQIYTYSQGIPRTQVILADNALLAAFVSGTSTIGSDIIHGVVKDRGLPDTQPLPLPRTIKKHKAGSSISSLRRAGDGR
jgi:general secretion pathway protein A